MPKPVLVVGSVALDTIEVPSQKVEECVGGSATYFSLACSLFVPTRVVAVIGHDFPASHWNVFKRSGIDTRGVKKEKGLTFRWHGRYSAALKSRETVHLALNVFSDFRPTLPAAYGRSPFVFLANIEPGLQDNVLRQAKGTVFVGMDTIDHWIRTRREELISTLRRVDALMINDEETLLLTEEEGYPQAARRVHEWGPRILVVKRGDAGSLLFVKGHQPFFAPAFLLEHAVDPTGAGDTFAGAFMGWLASKGKVTNRILREAVVTGSAAASFAVEDLGVHRLSNVKAADVSRRRMDLLALSKV
ncbi:MAG: sugar kinase [Nitrospirae bacterium]|nr:sugar kinase [Nitrospirota bacterium]